jgi:hypothetical protein
MGEYNTTAPQFIQSFNNTAHLHRDLKTVFGIAKEMSITRHGENKEIIISARLMFSFFMTRVMQDHSAESAVSSPDHIFSMLGPTSIAIQSTHHFFS